MSSGEWIYQETVTLKCGCTIFINEASYDYPSCRCWGNCNSDEGEWTYDIEMDEPCEKHGGKPR